MSFLPHTNEIKPFTISHCRWKHGRSEDSKGEIYGRSRSTENVSVANEVSLQQVSGI